jgi:hypothetical protein
MLAAVEGGQVNASILSYQFGTFVVVGLVLGVVLLIYAVYFFFFKKL